MLDSLSPTCVLQIYVAHTLVTSVSLTPCFNNQMTLWWLCVECAVEAVLNQDVHGVLEVEDMKQLTANTLRTAQ